MLKTVALLVENSPGVLTHVSGLISRRGFNIESIAASGTEQANITRISLVLDVVDDREYEQIVAQLGKLIQILKVVDMNNSQKISRELGLVKVKSSAEIRKEIIDIVQIFGARITEMNTESMVIEITDESAKIDTFCQILENYGIIEIIRTGEIFLSKKSISALKEA